LGAAYTAILNDSIQVIGTFLNCTKEYHWALLGTYLSAVFIATTTYSYFTYNQDISYERLASKG
jgi:hypothetical protein